MMGEKREVNHDDLKRSRQELMRRNLRFRGGANLGSCERKNKVVGLQTNKKRYDGSCEGCFRQKKWCGFDHEGRVWVKGRAAERVKIKEEELMKEARSALLRNVDALLRIHLLKFLARMEKHFGFHPISKANDPRKFILMGKNLDLNSFVKALRLIGFHELDREEVDAVFKALLSSSGKRGVKMISSTTFLRLCVAGKCFKSQSGIVESIMTNGNDDIIQVPLTSWHQGVKDLSIARIFAKINKKEETT